MKRLAVVLAAALVGATAASAHEGHKHPTLLGTVVAFDPERHRVEIKTPKGETKEIFIDAKTRFTKGKAAADRSALTPGTRVAVETDTVEGRLTATAVKIGAAAKPETPASPSPRP